MNKREMLIISALRSNCRKSLTEMSRETKIPISTLHEKIQSYSGNLIKKHTALIDFARAGYNTRAKVLLKVEKEERQVLQDFLTSCKNVNTLLKVNNGFDFLAEMVFVHIKEMEDFMESLEHQFRILNRETFYIIDELKREEFLSSPHAVMMNAV
ncbi:MAG TPA: Lrp/AsnC family transcriptional regulator [Nanoarchaeota archaeon]|nr:Lrp/AsnC family transcriptional regulator [Nanoarchaeota archaeon]